MNETAQTISLISPSKCHLALIRATVITSFILITAKLVLRVEWNDRFGPVAIHSTPRNFRTSARKFWLNGLRPRRLKCPALSVLAVLVSRNVFHVVSALQSIVLIHFLVNQVSCRSYVGSAYRVRSSAV